MSKDKKEIQKENKPKPDESSKNKQENKEVQKKVSKEVKETKAKVKDTKKDLIEETIKERKKLPKDVKNRITDSVFINIILIIAMMLITLFINVLFNKFDLSNFQKYMKFVQIGVCIISIGIFECSYRKDSFKIAIYGIEFVIFSIAVLYVPYMYVLNGQIIFLRNVIIVFAIYYLIKSIFTIFYIRNKYLKENISDVKEIVKDEKKGYLDEESTKTLKKKKSKKE